jgi:hypothetical protein
MISSTLILSQPSRGAETLIDSRLGEPLYKEKFKITSEHNMTIDGKNGSVAFFSGNGTLNGIAIKSNGKSLLTPRSNESMYIHGRVNFTVADSSTDRASYMFQAIGHAAKDGVSRSSGDAIFDEKAAGKLNMLSNLVGIFKAESDKNGTGTFVMWRWK